MSRRTVTLPAFGPPAGPRAVVRLRISLVSLHGRPLIAYAPDGMAVGPVEVAVGIEGGSVSLWPNAYLTPACRYLVEVLHPSAPAAWPPCTLPDASGPIDLATLLAIDAPAEPLDIWTGLLLSAGERAALSAATEPPSATNRVLTAADQLAAGVGHIISDGEGTDLPARARLAFAGATLTDDAELGRTLVEIVGMDIGSGAKAKDAAGTVGQISRDGIFIYLCYATNHWGRLTMATDY
jgi:hypothetical protein